MKIKNCKLKIHRQEGQMMLMTVLIVSTLFLSATAIAGLLIVYQLSQVTQVAESTKAIFAADSAIERGLFKVYRCNPPDPVTGLPNRNNIPVGWPDPGYDALCGSEGTEAPVDDGTSSGGSCPALPRNTCIQRGFLNDASYKLTFDPDDTADQSTINAMQATGISGKSARALEERFE